MNEHRRCHNCGALVADDARWCGQCYAALDGEPAAPEAVDDVLDDLGLSDPGWADLEGETAPAEAAVRTGVETGLSIRRKGTAVLWTCPQCEFENALEASVCARCGIPLAAVLATEVAPQRELPPPGRALGLSVLLTGLGHMVMGRAAEGVARLILFLWAAGLGVMMLLSPRNSGPIVMVGVVFVLAALGLWAVTALDAFRLASGDEEPVLRPRYLLIGTIALTVLSVGAFLAAGFSATTSGA